MTNRIFLAAGVILFSATLLISALLVRSGLLAVAGQIRDKSMPKLPDTIHITAGDPKLNVNVAALTVQPTTNPSEVGVSIDKIHVFVPEETTKTDLSKVTPAAPFAQPNVGQLGALIHPSTEPAK